MLALGAAMASIIGTTGAAMVMIRPMIRANRHRRRTQHIFVFFILLVANAGGALTPLGDPPLFLGHLKGVPFFWPLLHLWAPTLLVAPTYLVFFDFAGGQAAHLAGALARTLAALSAGAVFCGALTYVGNAPNLMVKSIVESHGIHMPGFFAYIGWAAMCLLPWLLLVAWIFFS